MNSALSVCDLPLTNYARARDAMKEQKQMQQGNQVDTSFEVKVEKFSLKDPASVQNTPQLTESGVSPPKKSLGVPKEVE